MAARRMLSAGQAYLSSFPSVLPFPFPPPRGTCPGLALQSDWGDPLNPLDLWCLFISNSPAQAAPWAVGRQLGCSWPIVNPAWPPEGRLPQPSTHSSCRWPSRYRMVSLVLVPTERMESEPLRAAQGGQNVGHVYHSCTWPQSSTPGGTDVHPFGR